LVVDERGARAEVGAGATSPAAGAEVTAMVGGVTGDAPATLGALDGNPVCDVRVTALNPSRTSENGFDFAASFFPEVDAM
jgi:hypothetical protein